jgi:DNA-binding beta-propeller fold protein YncE
LKRTILLGFSLLLVAAGFGVLAAQENSKSATPAPIVRTGVIPLPNVQGRIDHFAFDPKNRLFLSALGNNTEEIIDLGAQRVVHSIGGVLTPQGVAYSPETNKIFVASAKGKLSIFDGDTYRVLAEINLGGDVDNLRYDSAARRLYVGYGGDETAAIAMVDVNTNQRLDQEFKLGAHPESFQLEQSGPNIYVNLPDLKQIAVVNRSTGAVTRWPLKVEGNFPMALDEGDHRLFVVSRSPARLLVLDTTSGQEVAELPSVQDSDDVYYDASRRRIYASGGEGFISVFQQKDPDHYTALAKIPTAVGARTAGYVGKLGKKAFDRFYLAVPARAKRGAEVWIYTVQD